MKKTILLTTLSLFLLLFTGCKQMLPDLPKTINGIPTTQLTVENAKEFHLPDKIKLFLPENFDKTEMKEFIKEHYKDQISAEVIDYIIDEI